MGAHTPIARSSAPRCSILGTGDDRPAGPLIVSSSTIGKAPATIALSIPPPLNFLWFGFGAVDQVKVKLLNPISFKR